MAEINDYILDMAPEISAGEGGTACPFAMTNDQLQFQCKQLEGRDIVFTIENFDSTHENRSGKLVSYPNGQFVRCSHRLSHLREVTAWQGKAEEIPFPPQNTKVIRIVAAHVHMSNIMQERENEIERLTSLNKQLEHRVGQLSEQLRQADMIVKLQTEPNSPASVVGGQAARSVSIGSASNQTDSVSRHNTIGSSYGSAPTSPASHVTNTVHQPVGGVVIGQGSDTPGCPIAFPQAPGGGTPGTVVTASRQQPLNASLLLQVFSDRDPQLIHEWAGLLAKEQVKTVNDLAQLTEDDLKSIGLPALVNRRLIELASHSA